MKETAVLETVRPRLHERWLTFADFRAIFGKKLTRRGQREVVAILQRHGIEIVEELPPEAQKPSRSSAVTRDKPARGRDARPARDGQAEDAAEDAPMPHLQNEMLCRMAQEGDARALSALCVNNQGLIGEQVKNFLRSKWCNLEREDLEIAGMIGFLKAVEKFDGSMGNKLATYAMWWIRQSIYRANADEGMMIRVPVHMQERLHKIVGIDRRLEMEGVRDFGERERRIAAEAGLSLEQVRESFAVLDRCMHPVSLELPVGEDHDTPLETFVEDAALSVEDRLLKKDEAAILRSVLAQLTERERQVLMFRFGLADGIGRTLEQVGRQMGVTRERIRQIEKKALRRLRRRLQIEGHYQDLKEAYDGHPDAHRRKDQRASKRV